MTISVVQSIDPQLLTDIAVHLADGPWKERDEPDREYSTMWPKGLDLPWKTGRVFFIKIPPGGYIHKHKDDYTLRYIIPICTNLGATTFIGNERFHLEVGKVYSMDNTKEHWCINNGKTDRIHLCVDVLDE